MHQHDNAMLKKLFAIHILILSCCSSLSATEVVNVGGYIFPPFVEKDEKGNISGMTLDLIDSLNTTQNTYHFNLILTSSRRRYVSFQQGQFDMLFFENKLWGWQNTPTQATKVYLKGGEVFIALRSKAKSQDYFNNLKGKSIAAMLGYHYSFAGLNADPEFLRSKFNISLSTDERMNIQLVLLERMDVAIITKSYLDRFLINNPSAYSKLLISNKMDQEYEHTILVRKNTNPNVVKMNMLLDKLVQSGEYEKILQRYGIAR